MLGVTVDSKTDKESLVLIRITLISPVMRPEEFFVTASIVADRGTVQGKPNKEEGGKLDYTVDLNGCSVATLEHSILKAKHGQGSSITFRALAKLGEAVKAGDSCTLIVKVEHRGNKPHTETKTTTLIAPQAGKDLQSQREEEKTLGKNAQTPIVPLDTMPDSTTPSINHTTSGTDVPIPTDKVTIEDTSTQILVSDAGLCATPDSGIANAESEQHHSPPDVVAAPTSNTDESEATPTSDQFTVVLHAEEQRNRVKNFVLVTIQPSSKGMALKDFVVTASLLNNNGMVRVSSDKYRNSFIYRSMQGGRNLESIFLTDTNCLGRNNKSFADGASVSFKIEACPRLPVTPGDPYTLTVKIEHMANECHTKTKSIELTAPPQSPRKGRKQASPRNGGRIQGQEARR
ncbi:MAG: hypothetical protein MUC61_03325 [Amoebophilaceae bacterium]|nr:hypothetical protein [Amoebophilaceae bacterium]